VNLHAIEASDLDRLRYFLIGRFREHTWTIRDGALFYSHRSWPESIHRLSDLDTAQYRAAMNRERPA
jgi:hypothetical protein